MEPWTFTLPHVHVSWPMPPRRPYPEKPKVPTMWLSGLRLIVDKSLFNFLSVGERCNLAGSIRFKKIIKNNDFIGAMAIP